MIPPKLKEAYQRGSFGIFIGSGISRDSGLPNWKDLLLELIDLAKGSNYVTDNEETELKSLAEDSSKYLLLAEELREILHADLGKYIKSRFNSKDLEPSPTLEAIISLNYKFIITTNYDTLIEKAFVKKGEVPNELTYKDPATINDNLLNDEPFILKAHGDAKRAPNEIIITEQDYRKIIYREKGYQSVLHVLFSTCNILFLGVSMNDPELNLILGYIHNIFHGGSPDHFALMSEASLSRTEVGRWRKDFNINILPYDPHNNHIEVRNIIDELAAL